MQKDLENLAKEMQMILTRSSKEYYSHKLTDCRENYKWGGYEHIPNKKILISELYDGLIGQPPFVKDTLLAKLRLVEKGVEAFIMASDDEITRFHKIIKKEAGNKIKISFLRLFSCRQNLDHTHE